MNLCPSHSACLTGLSHHTYPHSSQTGFPDKSLPLETPDDILTQPFSPHHDVQFEKKMHFTPEDIQRFLDRSYGEKITGRSVLKKLVELQEANQPGIRKPRILFQELVKHFTPFQQGPLKHALAQMDLYGLFRITSGGETYYTSMYTTVDIPPTGYVTEKGMDLEQVCRKKDFLKTPFDGGLTGKQILETLDTLQKETIANHQKTLREYYEEPTGLSFKDQLKRELGRLNDTLTGKVPPHALPDEILTYKTYITKFPDSQADGLKKAMPEMLRLGFFKSTSCEWDPNKSYREQQPLGYNGYIPSEARTFLKVH